MLAACGVNRFWIRFVCRSESRWLPSSLPSGQWPKRLIWVLVNLQMLTTQSESSSHNPLQIPTTVACRCGLASGQEKPVKPQYGGWRPAGARWRPIVLSHQCQTWVILIESQSSVGIKKNLDCFYGKLAWTSTFYFWSELVRVREITQEQTHWVFECKRYPRLNEFLLGLPQKSPKLIKGMTQCLLWMADTWY